MLAGGQMQGSRQGASGSRARVSPQQNAMCFLPLCPYWMFRQQLAKALQKAGLPGTRSRSHSRSTRRRVKAFIKVCCCWVFALGGAPLPAGV